jgi:hypothetical protein
MSDAIKNSSEYRKEAQKQFATLAKGYCSEGQSGKIAISGGKAGGAFAFDVQYYSGELLRALGGAHFYYSGTIYLCDCHNLQWSAYVTMNQEDRYTFIPLSYGLRAINPVYMTARDLKMTYKYRPFTHTETWSDKFFNE